MSLAIAALGLVLVALVGAVAMAYHVIFRRPLPRTTGELRVTGLAAPVHITRSPRGVPHVVATTRPDACFAVGFLHGQDRLWQMEVQRRLAAGRLAEVLGARAVSVDRLMRRLGLRRVSEAEWHVTHASGPVREELLAYAAGVNAAMRDRPLAAEFTILRHQPEPWEPEDTLAVGRLLSFSQSGNWEAQLVRMRVLKELGPEMTAALDPVLGWGEHLTPDREGGPAALGDRWLTELSAAEDLLALSSWAPASNSWVVDGAHTTTGSPLLANDPHAAIAIPSPWYRVHLQTGTGELAGLTFCGSPYLVFGRNQAIAWGVVNANVSIQDLYVERFNPNNPLQFDDRGAWQDAVRFREVIRVRGEAPQREDVLVTRRGPIISPAVGGSQPPLSLRWTGFDSEVDSIGWARRLNLATDWKSFRAAVSSCAAPALGVTYADTGGNIGYRLSGFLPLRRPGQGRIPSRGWAPEDEWQGFISLEEMPELLNPADGIIVAANQPVAMESCPHAVVVEPRGLSRSARIIEALRGSGDVSPEFCAELQADTTSHAGLRFAALVVAAAGRRSPGELEPAVMMLRQWDGGMGLRSPAAALYRASCDELFDRLVGRRMSAALRTYLLGGGHTPLSGGGPFRGRLTGGLLEMAAGLGTAGDDGLLWESLAAAWRKLQAHQGVDPAKWSLEAGQRFHFNHPLAAAFATLAPVFNRGPFSVPGDGDTPRVGSVAVQATGERRVTSAFYRAVYDLAEGGRSSWGHVPGQSGHPASTNYADEIAPWLEVRLEPLSMDQAAPEGAHLVLRSS
ncbi:MAG: penicillin acylase family protein [Candidatus Dormibacteria bacterium]